ncbi:tetratricopeptide repeat protein [Actinacidiphila soli]|uniref:tetratricopeptide repeat protein n=1 Tax=Actinacidiphila soli TaxID=2487275 RepID=UPI000FCADC12|nr:tetratricopeptide repeat protein [Actinacidiphila soli]
MLDTPEAVFEALRENHERPYGLPRTVTAEELVEAAEQFEAPDALVTALLELMEAYEYTGEHRKSPVVFARILQVWDSKPEAFSEWESRQVFWRFKWVTTSLLQVPDIPLTAIQRWTDQMRDRYRDAGHGMQPVAAMRHRVAAHTGSGDFAAYDLWVTRPRDAMSDCKACEIRHRALHHLRAGDDGRALDVWRPVLDGGEGCSEEPYVSQAFALAPLLRLGRTDEARSHHLVGYRFARGKAGMAEEVGLHLEFCALSRNEGRGLEILAENRPLFDVTGAPLSLLGFLGGVQVLLSRLVEDGYATTAVAGPLGRNWTAETLLARVGADAAALAAAFDARNGTPAVGDRLRERLAQRPLLAEPLPLGLRTAPVAGTVAPAVPAAHPAAPPDITEDFAELVAQARQQSDGGHPGASALWARIAERVAADDHVHDPEVGPEGGLRADLAKQRAFTAYEADRVEDGNAAMTEAAELYEQAGLPWHVLVARARIASVSLQFGVEAATLAVGDPGTWSELDAVLREAEELLAATEEAGADEAAEAHRKYLTVLQCRAFAARAEAVAELPEISAAARERFDALTAAVLSEAARLDVPQQAATAHTYIADLAARIGDLEEAEAELRAALDIIEADDTPWRAQRAEALLGQVLMQQHRSEEAVEYLRQAMARAARYGDAHFPVARTHALLGHASSHTDDLAGAVRHLSEAAACFDREANDNGAAEIRLELADVLGRSGQQADAVAVLESLVMDDAASSVDERLVAQARLNLARGLRELDEHRASAEQFLLLADASADWDEQFTHTLAAAEAAVALARTDRWDAARTAYDRAVASHTKAPNPGPVGEMMRQFAALVIANDGLDGLDTALGHLSEADEVLAAVPEDEEGFAHWYEAGSTHYQRARALAAAERFPDALAEMERAIAAHDQGGPQGESPRAEAVRVAALIEANGLDSPQAATARLTPAIRRCEAAGLQHAARILVKLRAELASRNAG